jgi:carboxymethylenebutenolidase
MNDVGFGLSRRAFAVTAALASGFAASVQPSAAQSPIKTSADGLVAGEVKIPVKDGEIPAYRAMPASGGPFPIVLLIHEIWGVHEYFQDVCRRFAKEGYCAVAPELFARQGDASKMTDIPSILRDIVSKVPDAQVMSDLDATAAWAAKSSKGDSNEVAVTGFCWGGRHTWLYAAHNPQLKAAVAWYGRVVGSPSELNPKHPIDVAAELKAPVLGLYGGADSGIPVDTIEKMRDAAKAAGKTVEIVVYPDAPHAFHADYRPSYRAEPAADGWKRALAWFKQHGVA